ncbi:hypothetical protein NL108_012004 [Boleophthalmus pectinirostris]|nr:hypothetical protein NL108_012004 [Boleophthalmus pectinirostris]
MEVPRVNGHSEQTLITSDALLEIVRSHFQMIGPDGWEMLSRGSCDMQTKQIILSMFAQMVQNISTNVLRGVIPLSEVRVCTNVTESMRVLPTITAVLQESIGLVLARALNMSAVPSEVDLSIESQELTAMIENEVTHKVNSALSNTSKLQEQRSVIVVGSSLSSPSVASSIVDKALVCLKHCLNAQMCPYASRNPAATPVPASAHAPTAAHVSLRSRVTILKLSVASQVSLPFEDSAASHVSVAPQVSSKSFNSRKYDLFEKSTMHPQVVVPSFVPADPPAIVLKTPPQNQQKQYSLGTSSRESCLSQGQSVTQYLITALLVKLFKDKLILHPKNKTYKLILTRLTQKAWEQIELSDDQVKQTEKNMSQIIDSVRKILLELYGSNTAMLQSALDEKDHTFEDKLVELLHFYLRVHNKKKPSLLSRFCCCCCYPSTEE